MYGPHRFLPIVEVDARRAAAAPEVVDMTARARSWRGRLRGSGLVAPVALVALAVGVAVVPVLTASAPGARADVDAAGRAGNWRLQGWVTAAEDRTDQGLATVTTASGRARVVTRGDDSIPPALRAAGWRHIGDPDAAGGWLLDAYQGSPSATAKLYVLTAPDGRRYLLRHPLLPGEQYNNSFAAIAPDRHWFLSGEWGTMRRLLAFPLPTPAALSRTGGASTLLAAGAVTLDRPVRDVQGCAFSSATSLVCSTNDPGRDLFPVPRQLLGVRLAHPIDGRPVSATVSLLGAVPTVDACGRPQEVEGIDVHGARMLVAVVSGCRSTTTTFRYAGR